MRISLILCVFYDCKLSKSDQEGFDTYVWEVYFDTFSMSCMTDFYEGAFAKLRVHDLHAYLPLMAVILGIGRVV